MPRPSSPPTPSDAALDAYGELIVRVGVALRPGQRLLLRAPLHAAPLARRVVAHAYRAGSPFVEVMWSDDVVTRTRFAEAPEGSFDALPEGRAEAMQRMAERGDAVASIVANDPELLVDVDADRVATAREAAQRAMRPFNRYVMNDAIPWTVVAAAEPTWARKVFPELPEAEAEARLWEAILTAVRVDRPDPLPSWRAHMDELEARCARLDARRFDALRYRGPGTDLTVGLVPGHAWLGGGSYTPDGTRFAANMPTEEVFTAPDRRRVDGTVRATKPLVYDGRIVDDFELTFQGGRVVDWRAGSGAEVLRRILDTDDGAAQLGEAALVPVGGPIERSGVLFFDTLFDENAASHLALGRAYPACVQGGAALSDDEARERGLNDSLTHVDFMIGSAELDVDGRHDDGREEPIMRSGRFVI